ncbi:uncharacterized protein LOC115307172 [Manacus vitellinus]|uniref:uncharacterized protein LOC115307172 n=1 Tax=Manacus vitellinus TaxID=328815 RepID=UPI00115CAB8D|nr:uncharacterized protein LOC115307172 [Manacus vitellinus]
MLAKLIMKGRGRLQEMDGRDPETIYIPATKDNLDWLLAEDAGFQTALADFNGNISIHFLKHKLWAEIGNLPLMATRRCKLRPVNGVTVFTDASGRSKKAVVTWKNPATGQWDNKVQTLDQGSVQVLELAAIRMAFELFHALVMIKDLISGQWSGPLDLITWGRGYACVSKGTKLQWVPSRCVRPYISPPPQQEQPPEEISEGFGLEET